MSQKIKVLAIASDGLNLTLQVLMVRERMDFQKMLSFDGHEHTMAGAHKHTYINS